MVFCVFLALVFTRPFFNEASAPLAALTNDAALFTTAIIIILSRRKRPQPFGLYTFPLLFWGVAIILASLGLGDGIENGERTLSTLIGTLLFCVPFFLTHEEKTRLPRALFFAAVLIACLGFYQAAFGFKRVETYLAAHALLDPAVQNTLGARRIFYPFISPNLLGGFLAMTAPLGLIKTRRPWGLILVALALFMTRSIGAWTALIVGSAGALFLTRRPAKYYLPLIAIFGIGLAVLLWIRTNDPALVRQPLRSLSMRLEYGRETLALIRQHPFLGTGLGSFNLANARHAHNILLELWAEMGLAGLFSFLLLVGTIFKTTAQRFSSNDASSMLAALFASALIFFLHNQIDISFFFPEVAFAGGLIAGLCAAVPLESAPRPDKDATQRLP
jgi:O-antigen ligase